MLDFQIKLTFMTNIVPILDIPQKTNANKRQRQYYPCLIL
ncbi:hypothetical protein HMPREF0813_00957 [Streptococcus anginosus F0211]|uniref:Uncharacterized protein n=1 Tax=Streptococcus anginosus F0211 TaxID=706437 RepID=E6J133_STRAP|nr:hypothetical protein HMPREF0813_00957 [Streptococcus anginosus F0211]